MNSLVQYPALNAYMNKSASMEKQAIQKVVKMLAAGRTLPARLQRAYTRYGANKGRSYNEVLDSRLQRAIDHGRVSPYAGDPTVAKAFANIPNPGTGARALVQKSPPTSAMMKTSSAQYPALTAYLEKKAAAQEGMEKEAARILGAYGKHLIGKWGIGRWGVGSGLRTAGKWLGAKGSYNPKTGKWMSGGMTPGATGKQRIADWLATTGSKAIRQGDKMSAGWYHGVLRNAKNAGNVGQYNALRFGMPTAAAAYTFGAPEVFGEDSVLNLPNKAFQTAFQYGTPLGWGMTAGGKALEYGANKVQDMGLSVAEQAARTTADQMATGLYEQGGRMGHLYGLLDPQGYSGQVRQKAMDAITNQFQQLRNQ